MPRSREKVVKLCQDIILVALLVIVTYEVQLYLKNKYW